MLGTQTKARPFGSRHFLKASEVSDAGQLISHSIHESSQLSRAGWVTQLAQRLGFDLANALASHCERLSDFLEGVLGAIFESKAHLDDLFLARSERAQNVRRLLLEVHVNHGFGG